MRGVDCERCAHCGCDGFTAAAVVRLFDALYFLVVAELCNLFAAGVVLAQNVFAQWAFKARALTLYDLVLSVEELHVADKEREISFECVWANIAPSTCWLTEFVQFKRRMRKEHFGGNEEEVEFDVCADVLRSAIVYCARADAFDEGRMWREIVYALWQRYVRIGAEWDQLQL